MDLVFDIFPVLFICVFLLIFCTIAVTLIRSVRQWDKNNRSPRLTVPATVVSRRQQFNTHHHADPGEMSHVTHTSRWFVTFQVDSGDRMELELNGREYGLLVEGDKGMLTFQGTRYLNFERM